MHKDINFVQVKERYDYWYRRALDTGVNKLPYYEIESWDKLLNPVALRVFEDIKFMGIPLYPMYPLTESTVLHFANPFNKIAIEINYKNSKQELLARKLAILKAAGWQVYKTASQKSYYSFEEYFNFQYKEVDVVFSELDEDTQFTFLEDNKENNTPCLLKYIQIKHFSEFDYGANSDSNVTDIDELVKLLLRRSSGE